MPELPYQWKSIYSNKFQIKRIKKAVFVQHAASQFISIVLLKLAAPESFLTLAKHQKK